MVRKKVFRVILIILFILILLILLFAYRNLNYDYDNSEFMKKKGSKIGFTENVVSLPDGSIFNYGEGPNNGPPLLLLHGQMVDWKDYSSVLPELSKHFHIYAVDCYGHGKSSKDKNKYSATAIGNDLIWFIKNVIKEETIVSGHSSGALLTAYIAANSPDYIKAAILEDGPFFSTTPGRAQKTFSFLEFKDINEFLNQSEIKNYTEYYVKNTYMRKLFMKDGKDNFKYIVEEPVINVIKKNPNKIPVIWYYPPEIGINKLINMTKNIQDKTGDYDLYFGKTFYDFTWFKDFNQEETLKKIECPTLVLHVAPPPQYAPSYYNEEGIIMSAMDEIDAKKVSTLITNSVLHSGFKSSHDIHQDLPKEFIKEVLNFTKTLK